MSRKTLYLYDYSPRQSPLMGPTRYTGDESPTTPKRKPNVDSNGYHEHNAPTKHSSSTHQVLTSNTLDLSEGSLNRDALSATQKLTPMKRSTSSSQQATPKTIVKGTYRLQLDSHLSPNGAGLADPFGPVPPPVRPRLISLSTITSNSDASDMVKSSTHASTASSATGGVPFSRSRPARPGQTYRPALTATTATTKPQIPTKAEPHVPLTYVPQSISPKSPVKLRDSRQFGINPPFWRRWKRDQYDRLATFIQQTVDFAPFAEQEGLTVEEVQWVTYAVALEPLLDEKEPMGAVAQKRMEGIYKAFNEHVGPMDWRTWGDEESSVKGDLCGVRPGMVQLMGENADLIEVPFKKLGKVDREYVLGLLEE